MFGCGLVRWFPLGFVVGWFLIVFVFVFVFAFFYDITIVVFWMGDCLLFLFGLRG